MTNEQRRTVINEYWACCYRGGYHDGFTAMYAFEHAVKERP